MPQEQGVRPAATSHLPPTLPAPTNRCCHANTHAGVLQPHPTNHTHQHHPAPQPSEDPPLERMRCRASAAPGISAYELPRA